MFKLVAAAILAISSATPTQSQETADLREDALRTPGTAFERLPDYPFEPNYAQFDGYRIHFVDEGSKSAEPVLMLHGEPTWSYLYRQMIPIVAEAGHRVIAPDLIGFGKSDKPKSLEAHSYAFHVSAITHLIETLGLRNITLVVQDWGSLIGLRVAAENPERFDRIVLMNGGLPTGHDPLGPGFMRWREAAMKMKIAGDMPIGSLVAREAGDPSIASAYDAPFPDASYKAGPLAMPLLVPVSPDDPAAPANVAAWKVLEEWEKPFLTLFSDGDPITRGADKIFQERVPGARNQDHRTIEDAGHFLQEQRGEELARLINDFIENSRE